MPWKKLLFSGFATEFLSIACMSIRSLWLPAIAHASAKQASRADLTELVNFAFATSGISCADKMKRFNSECFELIGDVPAASDYYNRLCAAAAEQCHYFKGACELLVELKDAGALNFITWAGRAVRS